MVEPDRASWTARSAAYTRAYHYAHDSPRVFEDFLAGTLIPPEEREILENNWLASLARLSPEPATAGDRETALARWFHTWLGAPIVLGRARYNKDKLSDAISKGISQYVIVGAGLDTFALRRPDLRNRLRVFELDHPVTQALKRDRSVQAALARPPNLHFCPTDFERESVAASLSRSPYDPVVPTFFSWPGVTMYLTREAINNTLESIRTVAAPGSEIVMTDMAIRRIRRPPRVSMTAGRPLTPARAPGVGDAPAGMTPDRPAGRWPPAPTGFGSGPARARPRSRPDTWTRLAPGAGTR